MEKHKYHGVVNEKITRPSPDLIKKFEKFGVAHVVDAMGRYGVMHPAIKPLGHGMRVLGPACTVLTRSGDALYVVAGAECAQPGDVFVIDASGGTDACVIGERIGYYLQAKRKVNGVVVDGAIRDAQALRESGMPVFTRGVTPMIYGSAGPGAVNVPIVCGGVPVNPGDLIFGDEDGVVVVPQDDLERVAALAEEHLAGELERLDLVNQGKPLSEVQNIAARIAGWR